VLKTQPYLGEERDIQHLCVFVEFDNFASISGVENSTVPRPDILTRKCRCRVENGEKMTDIEQKNTEPLSLQQNHQMLIFSQFCGITETVEVINCGVFFPQ
jgi:hypothetical protein